MADQKATDQSSDILFIIGAIVVVFMVVGYFFGTKITYLFLSWKLIQLKLISSILPFDYFLEYVKLIEERRITEWTLKEVFSVGGKIGYFVNVPFIAIVAYWGYKVYDKNPMQKFKRVLNMQTLKESEQRIWPYIAPMVNVNLMKESFTEGPYAMAIKPYDFAIKYHLLTEEKNVNSLDRKKAEKLFISQLGKPWSGFSRLRKHEQAMLLIFAAYGCGDKSGAMQAINQIAQSAATVGIKKMPEFSSVKGLMKHLDNPAVKATIEKHGYVYTVLAQMLEFARGTGVFPPSYFIWLKTRDRPLWYILNCVGRQVSFVEVAGIFGHWKAEQIANHKLDAPFVTKAIDGLERGLSEVKVD